MQKILTVPGTQKEYTEYLATGNEYISIPSITPKGGVEVVNVIMDKTNSLIDFRGLDLIKPFVRVNGEKMNLDEVKYHYENSWIPNFELENEKLKLIMKIIAPKGFKGFAYGITIRNNTLQETKIGCGVEGVWEDSTSTVFHTRMIHAHKNIFLHRWTNSIILDLKDTIDLAVMAISGDAGCDLEIDRDELKYRVSHLISLGPGEEKTLYYYFSINIEQDGAGTTNIDLRRRGGDHLYGIEIRWLQNHSIEIENRLLKEKINRNLFFSYFYSVAYTLDTEEQVLLTSRSHKYYVSAAFWGRDSLLWSFPAICMMDKREAKKVLMTCYTRYLKNAGVHSLYINGSVLYPGFELDELAAYVIALEEYVEWTKDDQILDIPEIKQGLTHILEILARWHSKDCGLYRTELDPSDDPVTYPFLIYDNVLVWKALLFLSKIGYVSRNDADHLKEKIKKYGIVEGPFGEMYAWSTDGKGNYELYDDPPGSLILLSYYGFCNNDDKVYRNTVSWIYSKENKYYYKTARFECTGCIHSPYPWLMSICNYLLVFKDISRLKMLESLELDNGFACESFDIETGAVKTGEAFSTCAGFFGYVVARTFKKTTIC